jgi:hypothetical protein
MPHRIPLFLLVPLFFTLHSRASPALTACKKLDFSSSSLARNHEARILADKPDLTRPNFGRKYLLLNLPFMMENLWLIADCETGKFLKPTLDGKARFNAESLELELETKGGLEIQAWDGSGWTKKEGKGGSSPTPPAPALATGISVPCKKPDYSSYFKADQVRDNLHDLNPDEDRSNFGSHHRVLKNELFFETRWFLLDCRNGKFEREVLSGARAEFRAGQAVLILSEEGKFRNLLKWARSQWIRVPDESRSGDQVSNELEGAEARKLFSLLPNPARHSSLEFEALECESGSTGTTRCHVRMKDLGGAPGTSVLPEAESDFIMGLVRDFGVPILSPRSEVQVIGIHAGSCVREKSSCRFETRLR